MDGYDDTALVRYSLPESSSVTVSVVDQLGLMVSAPLLGARQKAGLRIVRLDPAVVPDGQYKVVVTVLGDSGRKTQLSADLAINRTLGWLRVDPSLLAVGAESSAQLTVSFELVSAALVVVEVRDGGSLLSTISADWLEPGAHAVIWNGSLPTGTVAPGLYEIWVTAATAAGTVTQRAPLTVISSPG